MGSYHRYVNLVQFMEKPDSKAKLIEELPKIVQVNWNLGQQMVLSPRRLGQNEPFFTLITDMSTLFNLQRSLTRNPSSTRSWRRLYRRINGTPGEEGSQVQEGYSSTKLFSRGFYFRKIFQEQQPPKNFHFNLCLFIVMKTSARGQELSPQEFPHLVQNGEVDLYAELHSWPKK